MGWTAYPPLSEIRLSPGVGPDLWILGIAMIAISSVMNGVNILTTVFLMRAPGMTMWRLPIFTWNMVVVSILGLVAFPPAAGGLTLLLIGRRLDGLAYNAAAGGDPTIYQHLFWFLGHPEVYILILPFFGVITEIIPVFSRKPLFGYTGFVLATLTIGALSTGVWAHHMFTTGVVDNPFFAAMTFLIAVPTGVKFFNWAGSMWNGRIWLSVPMLFSIGFMLNFLIGGVTGVMVASPPIDYQAQDTYFVVAHFHYTMLGGSVFGIFAAIYFWFPKMTGAMLREGLGRAVFVLLFVGFNLTFWPQFILGLRGMPRRYVDYPRGHRLRHPQPGLDDRGLRDGGVGPGVPVGRVGLAAPPPSRRRRSRGMPTRWSGPPRRRPPSTTSPSCRASVPSDRPTICAIRIRLRCGSA